MLNNSGSQSEQMICLPQNTPPFQNSINNAPGENQMDVEDEASFSDTWSNRSGYDRDVNPVSEFGWSHTIFYRGSHCEIKPLIGINKKESTIATKVKIGEDSFH